MEGDIASYVVPWNGKQASSGPRQDLSFAHFLSLIQINKLLCLAVSPVLHTGI